MEVLKKFVRYSFVTIITLMLIVLVGCEEEEAQGYDIYYKSAKEAKLVSYKYESDVTDVEKLAQEFVEQLKNADNMKDGSSLFTGAVVVEKLEYKTSVLNVYFNNEYNNMSSADELFLRAGLVKTLVQIEGVNYIQLYVDGALAQYSDGTLIGLLDATDFVDDSAAGMDSIQWKEIELYYANERGDKLVEYSEEVAYTKNVSLERVVVEKLIKGPSDKKMQATVPATIKLLDISVNDRVCYVNLDASFLNEMVNVSAELPVYSIVNTLCGLPGIDSVRIMVNGDKVKTYRETVKLDKDLTFNYDIVEYDVTNSKSVYQGK